MKFKDRRDAGQQLALLLETYAGKPDVLVLALPRGGVPVAAEIAGVLNLPLDIFLIRKLDVPGIKELAMGAIATGGVRVLNEDVVKYLGITEETIEAVALQEQHELERRERLYRGDRLGQDVRGKTVILVDDGLATGATMQAALAALRKQHPAHLIVAVPVAARTTCEAIKQISDDIVCVSAQFPEPLFAVGVWYEDFGQTTDAEIRQLLAGSLLFRQNSHKL
jgi:putative phosphoribosyl transferase